MSTSGHYRSRHITCRVDSDNVTHICSIVNSGSIYRLMILMIFLNDNFQKTDVTIS